MTVLGVDESGRAFQVREPGNLSRQRRSGVGVPVAATIEAFRAGCIEVIAQAEVEGQLGGDFPVILDERGKLIALRSTKHRYLVSSPAPIVP